MKSRPKPHLMIALLLALAWLLHAPAFQAVGRWAAARVGEKILATGQGKIENAAVFVSHRLVEALLLVSALWVVVLMVTWAVRRARSLPPFPRWLGMSLAGFAGLNLVLACAGQTVLFWVVLMQGAGTQNLAQFEIKRLLLAETTTRPRAALLGSSQIRAQVDEEHLNSSLAGRARAFELHFPGSRAADLLSVWREMKRDRPEIVVLYLSEMMFFTDGESPAQQVFHGFVDQMDSAATGGGWLPSRPKAYGLLSSILPAFRMRDALGQRIMGPRFFNLAQERGQHLIEADLEQRAAEWGKIQPKVSDIEHQYRALERLLGLCQRDGVVVLMVAGQLNPIVDRHLPAGLRRGMLDRLDKMAADYSSVTIWHPEPQTETDYEDLTHANKQASLRFTNALVEELLKAAERTVIPQTPGQNP